ncbi:MAG: flagellar assembly protein FliW [Pseudomonadota bacterium]
MKINTRKFGTVEIDPKKVLTMPEGLPGFPGFSRFVLIEDAKSAPFCWFQSVEEANLALVLINPFLFKPDYHFELDDLIRNRQWGDIGEERLVIYVVVNISGEKAEKRITANLMGPIVINPDNNETIQVILSDASYSHQHNLLAPES